jgi:hypothetical protein
VTAFDKRPQADMILEGELLDFIEEFSDGRIQFGFVKVKDPNTTLPKCVLVGWVCQAGIMSQR